jgi:gamma-glutamyltranspeptidase/glutathione hydrolase
MAATSHPLASHIALDVLKDGGSAVDAAIAANAALGLMEPTGNGIGGDLFAIVYDPASDSLYGLNASGRSPQALTYGALMDELGGADNIPLWGPLPVSVPGAVSGWAALHERFGRRPWGRNLQPAIRYARGGFPVTQVIAYYWASNLRRFEREADVLPDDNWKDVFLVEGEDGAMRAPREGEVFRNPDLADTYQRLADDGPDAFYTGPIADAIDAYMREAGGYLRKADLAAHEAEWVTPVSVTYRGVDVYELPPNGQGIAALQMLQILEGYDLAAMGHNSADYLHVQTEAKKLAFEDRARFYADPDFYDPPLDRLLSDAYAEGRRDFIRMDQSLQRITTVEGLGQGDTIYLTVADSSGMMVSLIQSNYVGMGSGLVPDGLGFMLQDRGALFTLEEGHPNVYAPGKRPFHTIIPAFAMKDGEPYLSFGVMGGAMQPQGHVQILCNILDFGMNVQEAGDAARYRHTGSSQPTGGTMTDGGTLRLESGVDPAVAEALQRRGHAVKVGPGGFGGYQMILWDAANQVYHGATELRKDGVAIGY